MRRLLGRVRRWRRDERGNATIEFVIVAPVFFMLLFMGVEFGLMAVRSVMLERGVDIAVRELRLGRWENPTPDGLRDRICEETVVLPNCRQNLLIELRRVNTVAWDFPAAPPACINRDEQIAPVTTVVAGGSNDMMLLRACMVVDPLFPTSPWGLQLPLDASGGFQMFALASFVNEPR